MIATDIPLQCQYCSIVCLQSSTLTSFMFDIDVLHVCVYVLLCSKNSHRPVRYSKASLQN